MHSAGIVGTTERTSHDAIVELGRWVRGFLDRFGVALVSRVAIGDPGGKTAVEDGGTVVAKGTEHVEGTRRRKHAVRVVAGMYSAGERD